MIRPAQPGDIDDIFRIEAGAFKFSGNLERCRSERARIERTLAQWLVQPIDGRIRGVVHVAPQRYQVGCAAILNGDVGSVAIDPEEHGCGLGTRMMRETVAWMHAEGFALSRLGGLAKFYARFGYQRFPRRYMEINVGDTGYPGNANAIEGEIVLDPAHARTLAPYDPAVHGEAVLRLLNDFNRAYNGAPQRGEAPETGPLSLVVLDGGVPAGYLRVEAMPREHTEFEARLIIREAAYDLERPYLLQNLVAHVANAALRDGITRLTARIPFDPRIIAALSAIPLRFHLVESYGGLGSNMLRVISLHALLAQWRPELEARAAALPAPWRGVLEVRLDDERAALAIDGEAMRVTEEAPTLSVRFTQYQLIALTLGILSFPEIATMAEVSPAPAPADRALLAALFPRQLVCSGVWG